MATNRKNLAAGILANSPGTSGTSFVLETGYGQTMPDVPFHMTTTPPGQLSTLGNSEIVEVTARTGDTLTVTRAQRGTTAKDIQSSWPIVNGIYVEDLVNMLYPVGSTYFNKTNSTNPATLLGFGTWARLEGVVLGGRSEAGGSPFNVAAGTVIGADTHTLTTGQLPQHGFSQVIHGQESGTDIASMSVEGGTLLGGSIARYGNHPTFPGSISRQNPGATWGSNQAHNNIQRTLVGYLWERTA